MGNRLLDQSTIRAKARPIVRGDFSWSVSFPKSSFKLALVHASLIKKPGHHDVLNLEYAGRMVKGNQLLHGGDPVKFVYGVKGTRKVWYGYVHHVVPTTLNYGAVTRVVCVGATWSLKNTEQKIYKNVTADQVVAKIVKSAGLKADTQRHPRVLPTVSNTGQSQWQLIRRLANQTGFALSTENMVVRFKPKDAIFVESLSKGLYFRYHDERVPAMATYSSIFNFQVVMAENSPEIEGGTVSRVVSGIHAQTDEVMTTKHKTKKHTKPHPKSRRTK
jgi:phage protein D